VRLVAGLARADTPVQWPARSCRCHRPEEHDAVSPPADRRKRRSLWVAAEDCPDGEQVENADLDVLLARLSVIMACGFQEDPAGTRVSITIAEG
jgi:hypothetical protein